MGMNFPSTPTNGQVFGAYTWDGEKWKLTPPSAASRYQRFSLGGLSTIDIQVPAGVKQARITGMVWNTASLTGTIIYLSVAAGVFRNTAGDYALFGFTQDTSLALPGMSVVAGTALPYMQIIGGTANAAQAAQLEALLTLARPDTGHLFNCESKATFFNAGANIRAFYTNFMQQAASGSALNILAIRISNTTVWVGESYINLEWM